MKVLLADLAHDWRLWTFIVGAMVAVTVVILLGFQAQRSGFQRYVDTKALQNVERLETRQDQILKAVEGLKVKDAESLKDRLQIKKVAEQAAKAADELKAEVRSQDR